MFCTKCGYPIPDDSKFCPYCGSSVQVAVQPEPTPIPEPQPEPVCGPALKTIPEAEAVSEVEPVSQPEPVSEAEPVSEPEPAPELIHEPIYESVSEEPKGRPKLDPKRKKYLMIGIAAALILAIAIAIPVSKNLAKRQKYNEGLACLESEQFDEAYAVFTELESFSDAEEMAERTLQAKFDKGQAYMDEGSYKKARSLFHSMGDYPEAKAMTDRAQAELDYQSVDALLAGGSYHQVSEIYRVRSTYYPDSEEGTRCEALAAEYLTVDNALSDLASKDYASAKKGFQRLKLLREEYAYELSLCKAQLASENGSWEKILVYLYAIQKNDPDCTFLKNPQTPEDRLAVQVDHHELTDYSTFLDVIEPQDEETKALKQTAEKGLQYDEAKEKYEQGLEEEALPIFEELGDFKDAKSYADKIRSHIETYQKAEEYYQNKEYYKARKEYIEIPDYKDAAEKAVACKLPLPESGSLKTGNGSSVTLTIRNPDETDCVFVRLYNADGNTVGQVFIRAKQSSYLNMAVGTYTMKVGYGTEWYGETDLFGPGGRYSQLLNGSDPSFEMKSGYTYELTLGGVTDGNVDSINLDGAGGM